MAKSFPIFSKKLVELRDAKGFTQESFSAVADISRSALARYETEDGGIASVQNKSFGKIAKAFGLSHEELMAKIGAPRVQKKGGKSMRLAAKESGKTGTSAKRG